VVYLARQTGLDRLVALKMILAGEHSSPKDQARFRSEAETVARLEHPNLVKIYETGEHDSRLYFSMEYVDGGRLSDSLRGTPMPPRRSAQLVETLANATHAAHERGVIHRDLTPSNILLTAAGEPKIVDFGLAKLTGGGKGRTVTGDTLGTPSYMAPEQASGQSKEVGPAADVYALGAILYDLLTGRPPFRGESVLATLAQVAHTEPVAPCRLQPNVPRDIETICLKCLNKEPARRYSSAAALAEDLRRYLAGEPVVARPISTVGRAARWARRRPAVATLLAVCATGALVAFAAVAWQGRQARLAARRAEHAQRRAEQAAKAEETQRIAAETARENETRERRLFQSLSAALLRDRALQHCDDGDVGRGLLWLAQSLRMVPDGDLDLERSIRTNLAGWQGQVHPLLAILEHADHVLAAGWSPDGHRILTAAAGKEARLWNPATGKDSGPPLVLPRAATTSAFSRDGAIFLTAAGQQVRLWKTDAGKPALNKGLDLGEGADLLAHSFSRDNQSLTTVARRGRRTVLQSWQIDTGQRTGGETDLGPGIMLVAFSPDGPSLVTAGEPLEAPPRLRRTAGGKLVRELSGHTDRIVAVAFNPMGGTFATGSYDQTCRLWSAASGEARVSVIRHPGLVRAVAFSPDGRSILVGGHERIAQLWNIDGVTRIGAPMRHPGAVPVVGFSHDGRLALTVSWDQVRLWDAATGELSGAPIPHQREVVDAAFSPDGKAVLTRSRDNQVRVWSTAPLLPGDRRLRHKGWVTAVAFHPTTGDSFLTGIGGSEGKVLSWTTNPGPEPVVALEDLGPILSLAYRPDGRAFTVGTRERKVWLKGTAGDQSVSEKPIALDDRVGAVAFSPDGRTLLTGIQRGRAEFWDVATGNSRPEPLRHDKAIGAVAYSPDGQTVLTGSEDATARLWDAATHQPLGITLAHQGTIYAVAFRPTDGQVILTGSDDCTARLWDRASGRAVGKPLLHPARVLAVAFSLDGRTIATGCGDGVVRLWDAAAGHPIGRPLLHRGPVRAVAFRPRPQSAATGAEPDVLVTCSEDMTARVWEVPPPLAGSPERLMSSLQVANGMVLDDQDVPESLPAAAWRQLRSQFHDADGPASPNTPSR
jgi:WD40 repeat protein